MIATVTLNPALDYIVRLPGGLKEGCVNRAPEAEIQFGGKGINVSLILKELGVESTALGITAGHTGAWLEQALCAQGLAVDFVRLPVGETRINVKLKAGAETDINAPGPAFSQEAFHALAQRLGTLGAGDVLVLSGSVPAGFSLAAWDALLAQGHRTGAALVVDTEGERLLRALRYHPFLIKPNREELGAIFGETLDSEAKIEACAAALQQQGAKNVLVSLGSEGALLRDETGRVLRRAAPKGKAVNTVGAGDSMVAGFLAGWQKTQDSGEALLWGTAAGAATAFSEGLAQEKDIRALARALGAASL